MTLSKTKRKKPGIVVNVFILYLGGGGKQISEFKVNLGQSKFQIIIWWVHIFCWRPK